MNNTAPCYKMGTEVQFFCKTQKYPSKVECICQLAGPFLSELAAKIKFGTKNFAWSFVPETNTNTARK